MHSRVPPLNTHPQTGSRYAVALALLLAVEPIRLASPLAAFWTTPCILLASILIAWGAESAQFFVAQGFALAILAWLQTLPEFAVEAVLAWHQQRDLLLANLTGALRLLVGLAWPIIYATAAYFHRKRTHNPLREIVLHPHHSIEVVSLILPLVYALFLWWKGGLGIYDSIVLIAIYAAYLFLLTKLPPQEQESIDDLGRIPRGIVLASRRHRILAIGTCFVAGGLLIYFTAEPFLASLMGFAGAIGIPIFIVVQWLAPLVSEFPELASTFYFARQDDKAPMALMNIVSSNINQWTLLVAMLPIVLSFGVGSASVIKFSHEQEAELLLTVAQSMVGLIMLLNMKLAWWEASLLFFLYACQVTFANTSAQTPLFAYLSRHVRFWITEAYFAWVAISALVIAFRGRQPVALRHFTATLREHF